MTHSKISPESRVSEAKMAKATERAAKLPKMLKIEREKICQKGLLTGRDLPVFFSDSGHVLTIFTMENDVNLRKVAKFKLPPELMFWLSSMRPAIRTTEHLLEFLGEHPINFGKVPTAI